MKNLSEKENAVKIGEIIPFSGYKWRVLDVQKNQALLLSDLILEERPYHREYTAVTWEICTLRHYLNKDFYNKLSEKSRIAQRKISNKDNQWFGTSGGNDTTDHIFLLSLEEIMRYFGDKFSKKYVAKDINGRATWWWLRSPGRYCDIAAYITDYGYIDDEEGIISESGGVRPALWINLQPNTKQLSEKIGNHKIRKGATK